MTVPFPELICCILYCSVFSHRPLLHFILRTDRKKHGELLKEEKREELQKEFPPLNAQETQRLIPSRVLNAVKQHLKAIVRVLAGERRSTVRKCKVIYIGRPHFVDYGCTSHRTCLLQHLAQVSVFQLL